MLVTHETKNPQRFALKPNHVFYFRPLLFTRVKRQYTCPPPPRYEFHITWKSVRRTHLIKSYCSRRFLHISLAHWGLAAAMWQAMENHFTGTPIYNQQMDALSLYIRSRWRAVVQDASVVLKPGLARVAREVRRAPPALARSENPKCRRACAPSLRFAAF